MPPAISIFLGRLVEAAREHGVIDAWSMDQDGSHVFIVNDSIHYLAEEEAAQMLSRLLREHGVIFRDAGSEPRA